MARLDNATSLGMEHFHLVRLTRLEARKRHHLCPEVPQPDAVKYLASKKGGRRSVQQRVNGGE
jgi:hypothetical protein